jgi:hypothetical protein
MDVVPGIIALLGAGVVLVTIVLMFWLNIHVYAEVDRNDPNSWWLVISSRYRRLAISIAVLYVAGFALLISATILSKYLR